MPPKIAPPVYDAFIFKTCIVYNNSLPIDRLTERATFCEWRLLYVSEEESVIHGFVQLKYPVTFKGFNIMFPEATFVKEYCSNSYAVIPLYANGGQTFSFGAIES